MDLKDKEQSRKKLFEVMEKIAWLPVNENYDELGSDEITGDVKNLNNLGSPARNTALKRINTQREFNEAFESWFNSLGFNDPIKSDRIKIATTIRFITDIMKKNNIKF